MDRIRVQLAAVVGLAWAGAVIDSIATNNPEALGFITPVMLVVVTGLFTLGRNGKNGKQNGGNGQ